MTKKIDTDFLKCPVCGIGSEVIYSKPNERDINCTICGSYSIDLNMFQRIVKRENHHILSGYIRNRVETGSRVYIEHDKVEEIIKSVLTPNSPLDYVDEIILRIYRKVSKTNDTYIIHTIRDYSLFYCHDSEELAFLLDKAKELGYIEEPYYRTGYSADYRLTLKGWERVQELRTYDTIENKAFVAMWFDESMKSIWSEGFYETLREVGYEPVRIDQIEHNGKICDRIIAEINKCSLLIADFTGHRGGVYFEAGYAMGKGIPVIWTCREDQVESAHFDTRQYNHIAWNSIEDLSKKLKNRIEATIPILP